MLMLQKKIILCFRRTFFWQDQPSTDGTTNLYEIPTRNDVELYLIGVFQCDVLALVLIITTEMLQNKITLFNTGTYFWALASVKKK